MAPPDGSTSPKCNSSHISWNLCIVLARVLAPPSYVFEFWVCLAFGCTSPLSHFDWWMLAIWRVGQFVSGNEFLLRPAKKEDKIKN